MRLQNIFYKMQFQMRFFAIVQTLTVTANFSFFRILGNWEERWVNFAKSINIDL